jgi:hypothetical protein
MTTALWNAMAGPAAVITTMNATARRTLRAALPALEKLVDWA